MSNFSRQFPSSRHDFSAAPTALSTAPAGRDAVAKKTFEIRVYVRKSFRVELAAALLFDGRSFLIIKFVDRAGRFICSDDENAAASDTIKDRQNILDITMVLAQIWN